MISSEGFCGRFKYDKICNGIGTEGINEKNAVFKNQYRRYLPTLRNEQKDVLLSFQG